ncbi:hypothetical protein TELCIR_23211 [Teladorsagia circumcincta]|uniref:Uncharacterized protein n=1 Tax=Teladorsagia circumcincta TaxID=45464 RepID=A0A2G9TBS4_TELCI|nr:hypothetical protein TELCIR_23211 [Teladorsagia circumcincta]
MKALISPSSRCTYILLPFGIILTCDLAYKRVVELADEQIRVYIFPDSSGAIATEHCTSLLQNYINDKERVVRESCEVALDMAEYENSDELNYATVKS